jgi:beta-lactamase regulating signal transducer with metallopeptidase domain
MFDLLLNHLWQSTLFAFAAGLLMLALRRQCAQVRFWVWFCASLKFLIPFAALTALGAQLSWRAAGSDPADDTHWRAVARQLMQPMSPTDSADARGMLPSSSPAGGLPSAVQRDSGTRTGPSPEALPAWLPAAALAVWALGTLTIALIWTLRWIRLRRLAQRGKPVRLDLPEAEGVAIRSIAGNLEPGVFGLLRPVLLLPAGIVDRLSPAQLAAVIRHECCHIQRRDNLTALVPMIVAAVYWFYPLVWWLGTRLVAERERACDESVLAAGVPPHTYASGILEVCSSYLDSPLPCTSGVGAGSLKQRIHRITANRTTRPLGTLRKAILVLLPGAAMAVPFWAGIGTSTPAHAQADAARDQNELVAALLARRAYFAALGPLIRGPTTDDGETRFIVQLTACEAATSDSASSSAASSDAASNDISDAASTPEITSLQALIAYVFNTADDQVILPQGLQAVGLVTASSPRPRIDPAACRELLRRSLEQDYGLLARVDSDQGLVVVDRLDWPGLPPDPVVLTPPGVAVDPDTLDAYTGYFARPNSGATTLAPVFRIRRQGRSLLIEWDGESFELAATSPTDFSAPEYLPWQRRQQEAALGIQRVSEIQAVATLTDGRRVVVTTDHPTLDLHFSSNDEINIVHDFSERNWLTNPTGRARRIDSDTAEAALAELERRRRQTRPDPASESLVRAMVESLGTARADDDSTAADAARRLREHLDRVIPGVADRLGTPRIALREVLPSGRDVYDVVYNWIALRVTIGTDAEGRAVPLKLAIDCQRQSESHLNRFGGCRAR